MIRFYAQALLIVVVVIVAWRAGGKPERYVASIYLGMLIASGVHALVQGPRGEIGYGDLHTFRFALDCAGLAGVLLVALYYDRWWTLWVGSAQSISVMAHLLRALDWPIPPIAYAVMERWPVWLAVIFTGIGTLIQIKEHRRGPIGI